MAGNLLELISGYLTPSIVSKMAGIVGESPALTQKAVDVAIPTLAGAACNQASTPNGANNLLSALSPSKLDSGIVSNFGNYLTGGATTAAAAYPLPACLLCSRLTGIRSREWHQPAWRLP